MLMMHGQTSIKLDIEIKTLEIKQYNTKCFKVLHWKRKFPRAEFTLEFVRRNRV
jgi:hypothetical protein